MPRTIDDLIQVMKGVDDGPESKCGFDMGFSAATQHETMHACGAACCIGGHAALALGDPYMEPWVAVNRFGVCEGDAYRICYPGDNLLGWYARPHNAIALLEHYRDTGKVDWIRAMDASE